MRILAASLLLLAACAAPQGIGHLDRQFVQHVQQREGAWRVKIHVDDQGDVVKLSVYHRDAGAVPKAIVALAEQRFPGGKIVSYETELHAGDGWVHEVEVTTAENRNCELSATEAGGLRYVECRLASDEVKPEILQQARAIVPGGELQEAETHEGQGGDQVRLEIQKEAITHYLVFTKAGELASHELRLPAILGVPPPGGSASAP